MGREKRKGVGVMGMLNEDEKAALEALQERYAAQGVWAQQLQQLKQSPLPAPSPVSVETEVLTQLAKATPQMPWARLMLGDETYACEWEGFKFRLTRSVVKEPTRLSSEMFSLMVSDARDKDKIVFESTVYQGLRRLHELVVSTVERGKVKGLLDALGKAGVSK